MLAEKARNLTMEVNELKEIMFNNFGLELFETMDGDAFEVLKKCFNVFNHSMELVEEEAITIQKINEKLDILLSK